MIEDFDNIDLDDNDVKGDDDGIVDEVEEEDALRMIDEEIMNTAVAKQDARKLKDLISKIDSVPRSENTSLTESVGSAKGSDSNSGSFKQSKAVD